MELPVKKKLRRAALHELQKGTCSLEELGQCLLPGVPMTLERGSRRAAPPDTFASLSPGGPLRPDQVSHYKCKQARARTGARTPRPIKPPSRPVRRYGSVKFERWKQQNGRCPWCGLRLGLDITSLEHIIPESLGGTRAFENLAVAHPLCNHARGEDIWKDPVGGPAFDFIRDRLAPLRRAQAAGDHLVVIDGKAYRTRIRVEVAPDPDVAPEAPLIRWSSL